MEIFHVTFLGYTLKLLYSQTVGGTGRNLVP